MSGIVAFIEDHTAIFILGSVVLNVLLALLLILNYSALTTLKDRYKKLTRGMTGKNIESILFEHIEKVEGVHKNFDEINSKINLLNNRLSFSFQKIGFIRYNAFDDVGSDLSFSIAILDDNNNGFILTGIHGRAESYTYAKSVKNGTSSYHISVEEEQALERAMNNQLDATELKTSRSKK
ncbi:DUF4446 family protein [Serpentinicella sp. ANB-PHB4]|uniref:DUF4446 family protein n=1 Tax=Serpentinicella sp. ANB-PHB4 TaxID=3074076 RepID=UPI002864B71F|nr:DUF4446 family protein [Serpentinicella sp. ANB-PHB4]MDR5658898.1 DUF4446 family protein [Serpentinicella sp. ANB-PHB4]